MTFRFNVDSTWQVKALRDIDVTQEKILPKMREKKTWPNGGSVLFKVNLIIIKKLLSIVKYVQCAHCKGNLPPNLITVNVISCI